MRPDRPSLTATIVSFARGAMSRAPDAPCYDPVAGALVPSPWRGFLSAIESAGPARRLGEAVVRGAMFGLAGHIELRTALIDAAVREAVAAGVDQLVILGAGLDARAYRLPELASVDVYEVDHPATQAWKRRRVAALKPSSRSLHFVEIDFAQSSLREGLEGTGQDPARRAIWIWEGVTMYLPREATSATLAGIAARSAPGSRLVLTYLPPELVATSGVGRAALPLFRAISEPLIGILTTEDMHALLGEHGFRVLSDERPVQTGPRFGRRGWSGPLTPAERVLVAER